MRSKTATDCGDKVNFVITVFHSTFTRRSLTVQLIRNGTACTNKEQWTVMDVSEGFNGRSLPKIGSSLPGTRGQTPAGDRRYPLVSCSTLSALRMARCLDRRQARDIPGSASKGFRVLWRWKSKPCGRPRLREDIQRLILRMARENPTWGEERIAAELLRKLGIQVSARTVRRYMSVDFHPGKRVPSQQWMIFVQNHAQAILACDFFIAVTASFRVL